MTPVAVTGPVIRGDERGRLLGFPTANLALDERAALLPDGVYAGRAVTEDGAQWPVAISIGRRPTFHVSADRLLEAHLVDFRGDLYGRPLEITILEWLRDQVRFSDVSELTEQLSADVNAVRALWSSGALGEWTQ